MKNFIVFICACFLTIFLSEVRAGERENAIAQVDDALVLVRQICVFNVDLKTNNGGRVIITETIGGIGTGFFIDKPKTKPNDFNILSAGHVVDCSTRWYTKRLEDIVPYGINALELKSAAVKTEIKYKNVWYPALVENLKFDNTYLDYALLLTTELPSGTAPHLIPYGLKRGEYKAGSNVVFRGFMGVGAESEFNGASDGMMVMLDDASIQFMGNDFFRISLIACKGMSGSPILFWKGGKYYAIGIVSAMLNDGVSCGTSWKTAIITDLNFLNIDDKTVPN